MVAVQTVLFILAIVLFLVASVTGVPRINLACIAAACFVGAVAAPTFVLQF